MNNIIPNLFEIKFSHDENLFFECLRNEITNHIIEKKDKLDLDNNDNNRILFSSGSSLFRGYFCPNPIEEIIIGNVKRGTISKNKKTKKYHKYVFSDNSELQTVLKYDSDVLLSVEKLIHLESVEHGYLWSCDLLGVFTECVYNNKKQIEIYSQCRLNPLNYKVMELEQFCYCYENEKMIKCNRSKVHFYDFDSFQIKTDVFSFNIDNGKIKSYIVGNKEYNCRPAQNCDLFIYKATPDNYM